MSIIKGCLRAVTYSHHLKLGVCAAGCRGALQVAEGLLGALLGEGCVVAQSKQSARLLG